MLAVGLPTGNRGNLDYFVKWAGGVLSGLSDVIKMSTERSTRLRVSIVLHHSYFFAGMLHMKFSCCHNALFRCNWQQASAI